VAHVELSLSELIGAAPRAAAGSIEMWAGVVAPAREPCLLLDHTGRVVAASAGCAELFAIDAARVVSRHLVGEVLALLDFNLTAGELPLREVDKIPPLLAISSGGLARGLVRVRLPAGAITVDVVSAPLRDAGGEILGSISFFALVT
jgi:hypothetical protein